MKVKAITAAKLAIVTTVLTGSTCLGQEAASLFPPAQLERLAGLKQGEKIRVRFYPGYDGDPGRIGSEAQLEVGRLESCRDGNLVIKPEQGPRSLVVIPLDSVENVQVRRGKPGDPFAGAALGFLVGLVVSFATQTNDHQDEWLGGLQDMEENINRGVRITLGTTLLGALIGSATGGSSWEDLDGSVRSTVSVAGSGGGVGLAVACSF